METIGVIKKIEKQIEWVHSFVPVTKPNGKLHVCLDPRNLKVPSTRNVNKHFVYIMNSYISIKYDILTEYLTLFWFAMLVYEYKPYFRFRKSSKDGKFGQ